MFQCIGTRSGSLSQSRPTTQNGPTSNRICSHSFFRLFMCSPTFPFEVNQPCNAIVQNSRAERINHKLAPLFGDDQVRLPQQVQMMRNGGLADRKAISN